LRRNSLRTWVAGAIMAAASLHTNAAGLGPLEVNSVLGEPLRAEISVAAKPGELASLKARLASPSAYEAAGLVYTGIVSQLTVTLKKDGGKPALTITSAGPINEPVVDLLLELTWSSGRVTREYTAFIDPPFIAAEREERLARQAAAAAKAEMAEQGAETQAASLPNAPTPEPLPEETVKEDVTEVEAEEAGGTETVADMEEMQETDLGPVEMIGGTDPTLFTAEPSVVTTVEDTGEMSTYISGSPVGVIRGDTLSKIALANKPAGVTLEQMLVVLFRNNPQAFSGNNMNRLRTGKIIRLAEPQEYKGVTTQQARKEVRVQYADWNAYRDRLAVAAMQKPAAEQAAQQTAGGAVTPKVEDRAPSQTDKASEVVKLSKGEPAMAGKGGTGQGSDRALQEKLVASEKALKESTDRVARLEKIIGDLQKLAEVKNQDLAQLQSQAATPKGAQAPKPPAAASGAQPQPGGATTASPPAAAGQQMPKGTGASAVPGPTTAPAAAPSGQAGVQAPAPLPPAPTGESAQAQTPAAQKPTRRPPAPPPPPPPSLLDQLLQKPYLLAVPLVVLLLVGFGVSRLRGRKRESKAESDEVAPATSGSSSTAARAAGTFSPKDTDVGLASTRHGDGAEEVDPLEEAEIFLAYGRDAQAEQLLKEAIAAHPARYDVHAKLLEIYAKRNDKAAFEGLAKEVQRGTGGQGEIWDRIVRLGYSIDPQNARYADGHSDDGDSTVDIRAQSEDITSTTDRVDFEFGDEGADSSSATDFDPSADAEFGSPEIVDPEATMEGTLDTADLPTMQIRSGSGFTATDLDLSSDGGLTATDLDLNAELPVLDSEDIAGESGVEASSEEPAADSDEDAGLEFNMDGISFGSGDAEQDKTESEPSSDMPALDLSGISLDLDGETTTDTTAPSSASSKDEKWYEVQTKFDLAKAYQEMGDSDGAKEILQEVISEGDSEQKAAAESVLATLD